MEEHNKTLEAVLQRAVDFGITFNPDKCQVLWTQIHERWIKAKPREN